MLLNTCALQNELLILSTLNPDSSNSSVGGIGKLHFKVNRKRFLQCLNECISKCDVFKITIVEIEGVFHNKFHGIPVCEILEKDFSSSDNPDSDAEQWFRRTFWNQRFKLDECLTRFAFLKISDDEFWLCSKFHHSVFDGYSYNIFFGEMLSDLYINNQETLADSSYKDAISAQLELAESDRAKKSLLFWAALLKGKELRLFSPKITDSLAANKSSALHSFSMPISDDRLNRWKEFAVENKTSLQNLTLVALKSLFSSLNGRDECVFGFTTHGRTRKTRKVIGTFADNLPVLLDYSENISLSDALSEVTKQLKRSYRNSSVCGSVIAIELLDGREDKRLFDVSVNEFSLDVESSWGGETVEIDQFYTGALIPLDFFWRHIGRDKKTKLTLSYMPEYFQGDELETLVNSVFRLLDVFSSTEIDRLSDVQLITENERQRLRSYSVIERPFEPNTIHGLFENSVNTASDKVALVDPMQDREWTYRELDDLANRLAHYLISREGWKVGNKVGICLDHSAEMMISILGVLKAGGAYVPLDSSFPQERLAYMASDAGIYALITSHGLEGLVSCDRSFLITENLTDQLVEYSTDRPSVNVNPNQLAYVIYTSGSTGRPKGVLVEHGGLSNLADSIREEYGQKKDERVLQFSSWGFDMSVESWMGTLCNSATLVLRDQRCKDGGEYFWEFCKKYNVNGMHLPTAFWQYLVTDCIDTIPRCIEWINITGEAVSVDHLKQWFTAAEQKPLPRLLNAYGPTEVSVTATLAEVKDCSNTIGRPLKNVKAYVLDKQRRQVPLGVAGELYLGGVQVARGYLGLAEKTAEVFIESPFEPGQRLYATGDLVRWLPNAELEYLGRTDNQIQLRGFRIEPGEIERVLISHVMVNEAVCLAAGEFDDKRLVAYIGSVAEETEHEALISNLRDYCLSRLPDYMVPGAIIILQSLPVSPTGKVDRGALPAVDIEMLQAKYESPVGVVEEKIAGIWCDLLQIERVGRRDNFFHLGGHSLLATRFMSAVRAEFDVEVSFSSLFDEPRLKEFAKVVVDTQCSRMPKMLRKTWQAGETAPVSFTQNRLWFIDQLSPGGTEYKQLGVLKLSGKLSEIGFKNSVNEIYRRHEVLRTGYVQDESGVVLQVVNPFREIEIDVESLTCETVVQSVIDAELDTPFDLAKGNMLRVRLLRLDKQEHIAVFCLHHIASDGWSETVFLKEFEELYSAFVVGRKSQLAEPELQYRDYARWQHEVLSGEYLAEQTHYWKEVLSDLPLVHDLPLDFVRPITQSFNGISLEQRLSADVLTGLHRLATKNKSTLFMVLNAAVAALLGRYSGSEDIVVGTPIANRQQSEVAHLIGFFANSLVIRTDLSGNPSFAELIARSKERLLGAYEHQQMPFEMLVDELNPERSTAHSPLFQVMLSMQNTAEMQMSLPNIEWRRIDPTETNAKFDLSIDIVEEQNKALHLKWNFATDLFSEATIARMMDSFELLLRSFIDNETKKISKVALISEEDKGLIKSWQGKKTEFSSDRCVHELIEAQVCKTPHSVALVFEGMSFSYADLNAKANQLARYLKQERRVRPDTLVGICLERSLELVISILGVLKSGGAYVPLDPDLPKDRVAAMIEDSGISTILTKQNYLQVHGLAQEQSCLWGDEEFTEALGRCGSSNLSTTDTGVGAGNLAYMIYTSGSTGKPKGVMIEHASIINRVEWMHKEYGSKDDEAVLQKTPYSFDVSVWEFLWPLMRGIRMVIAKPDGHKDPEYLARLINEQGVTKLHFVPSMLNAMLAARVIGGCESIRQVFCSGEALFPTTVKEFYNQLPTAELHNLYGPTEAAVDVSYWQCTAADAELLSVPIGKPVQNTQLYIVDSQLNLVPVGVAGELCIGGVQVGRGYFNRTDLTDAQFVDIDFGASLGGVQSVYRTGDLARYLSDGNIEYLGRIDHQVKLRGFRIELAEIEGVLCGCEGVIDAVVVLSGTGDNKQLIGYVVNHNAVNPENLVSKLREHVKAPLPDYMQPSQYMVLNELPLTASGKVNRKALPAVDIKTLQANFQSPVGIFEQKIAEIWQVLLKVKRIGRHDNFFHLGGHSLLATRCISAVRREFGLDIALSSLFCEPSLMGFAEVVADSQRSRIPEIQSRTWQTGETAPVSYTQNRLWFIDQLSPGGSEYHMPGVLELNGELNEIAFNKAIQGILQRHEVLRTVYVQDENGEVLQVVNPSRAVGVRAEQLPGDADRQAVITAELAKPFDLSKDDKLRVKLFRQNHLQHIAVFCLHHIASDGWSVGVLLTEFEELYSAAVAGRENRLPELALQYRDYAVWQRDVLSGDHFLQQISYWKEVLSGLPLVHNLPLDFPRPEEQSFKGASIAQHLSAEVLVGIKSLAIKHEATVFMVLNAAVAALLGRYSHSEDVVVGTPIANREQAEVAELIGFFVNTLVIRTDLGGDPDFAELIARSKACLLGAYAHQQIPFEKLVDELNPERSTAHSPLFQVLLTMQNNEEVEVSLPGLEWSRIDHKESTAQFELSLDVSEVADNSLHIEWNFATDLFTDVTINRMMASFELLLLSVIEKDAVKVSTIDITSDSDKALLSTYQGQKREFDPSTIHSLFESWADAVPHKIALVDPIQDREWTYRALDEASNRLAHYLLDQKGWKPENIVGICLDHSAEMMISILGVLKAGGAYLPLDSSYPRDRLAYMVKDAGVYSLITSQQQAPLVSSDRLLILEENLSSQLQAYSNQRPGELVQPESLAYVIYTSGSTGQPKGVLVEHGGVSSLVATVKEEYGLSDADRMLKFASWSFDISVEECFGALCNGATLVLRDQQCKEDSRYFWQFCEQHEITSISIPTAFWHHLVSESLDSLPGCLKLVVIGGEAVNAEYLKAWLQQKLKIGEPFPKLLNTYGPTEATVTATLKEVADECNSIGRPLNNMSAYVLDKQRRQVPPGVVGELYLGGIQVARGYLGLAQLTEDAFIESPFESYERLYATGDLVQWLPEGELAYRGRVDDQVKISGYRIELAEIETVIAGHTSVNEVVVLAIGDAGNQRLVAYVGSAVEERTLINDLRSYCSARLPEYMAPGGIAVLKNLPTSSSGKIDRRALSDLDVAMLQAVYEAPQGELEHRIALIWQDILKIERVGRNDNFFHLGGHSLLATRLITEVRKELGVEVELSSLFLHPGLRDFSITIAQAELHRAPKMVAKVWEVGEAAPVSYTQSRLWFIDQLDPGGTEYIMPDALRFKGEFCEIAFNKAIQGILQRHEVLRTMFVQADNGEVLQVVNPLREIEIEAEQVASEKEIKSIINKEVNKPFDLARDEKLRVRLLKHNDKEHVVVLCLHHIAGDGWSEGVFVSEFEELYSASVEGRASRLPNLEVQYRDYTLWQREVLNGEYLSQLTNYWKNVLKDAPSVIDLPIDYERPIEQSFKGASCEQNLSADILAGVNRLAAQHNATLFMVLNAAMAVILGRYSASEDVVVGTPVANREQAEVVDLLGFFVNSLVIRTDLTGDPTFAELIGQSKEKLLGAYAHQQMPFGILVEELNPVRSTAYNPLFQVLLTMQNNEEVGMNLPGLKRSRIDFPETNAMFDLAIDLLEVEDKALHLEWNFATDLFNAATITRMMNSFELLLTSVIKNDAVKVGTLELISEPKVPLGLTGKVDANAVSMKNVEMQQVEYEAPATELEQNIALIWQKILQRESVGRNDNFFQLGGHSFLAMRMLAELKVFGYDAPLKGFYRSPTLSSLAQMTTITGGCNQ